MTLVKPNTILPEPAKAEHNDFTSSYNSDSNGSHKTNSVNIQAINRSFNDGQIPHANPIRVSMLLRDSKNNTGYDARKSLFILRMG